MKHDMLSICEERTCRVNFTKPWKMKRIRIDLLLSNAFQFLVWKGVAQPDVVLFACSFFSYFFQLLHLLLMNDMLLG